MTTAIGRPQEWAYGYVTCRRLIDDPSGEPCLDCKDWVAFEVRLAQNYRLRPAPICLLTDHRCRQCSLNGYCPCYDSLADVILATEAEMRRLEA